MFKLFAPTTVMISLVLATLAVRGEDAASNQTASLPAEPLERPLLKSALVDAASLPETWETHPLARALMFAAERQVYIDEQVKDFSCILAKRERINGRLRDYEYLRTYVRRRQQMGDQTIPFAVYAEFLAPKKVKGRKVLYVEGRNEDKMLVRNGGVRFGHVIVNISPTSDAALRESRYPITELGLSNVVGRLIEQARHDMIADPEAENTEVAFFRDAEIDERVCTHIRVTHPKEDQEFDYHEANIYVDDKLNVPLRVESYTWPKEEGGEKVLMEEYTYTRLKLNVGLTDRDFAEELVRGQP